MSYHVVRIDNGRDNPPTGHVSKEGSKMKTILIVENNWFGRSPRPNAEQWGKPDDWTAALVTQTLGDDGEIVDESERSMVHDPDEWMDAGDSRVAEVLSDEDTHDNNDNSWNRCQRLRLHTESAAALTEAIRAGFAAGAVDEWDDQRMEAARTATASATWDFEGWATIADQIKMQGYVILGGVVFANTQC